jgi:uncharacterized protein YehS (DUF1456 family)
MEENKAIEIDLETQLIASLKYLIGENKTIILGIMNLLEIKEKQEKMMGYLKKNHQNKELMKEDKLLYIAQKITNEK